MTIKTKYGIGMEVLFYDTESRKKYVGKIDSIEAEVDEHKKINVSYWVYRNDDRHFWDPYLVEEKNIKGKFTK